MQLFEQTLQAALNRALALDPELPSRLRAFEGKVIALEFSGINQTLYLLPHEGGLDVKCQIDGAPDATLRGSPIAMCKMGLSRDVAPLLLKGEVEIIGDMRLGRAFKAMLAEMDIDWEEQLSHITGDALAHELVRQGKKFLQWGKTSGESLALDVSEYLQEESRDVVTAAELQQFYDEVDELRADVERLAAKLKHYAQEAC